MEKNSFELNLVQIKEVANEPNRDLWARLQEQYGKAYLAVIEEHDYYDHESWIHSAYFNQNEAQQAYQQLTPRNSFTSMRGYFLIEGTVLDLQKKVGDKQGFNHQIGIILKDANNLAK